MEYIIALDNLAIPYDDILAIQALLKDDDIICSAFDSNFMGNYSFENYIREQTIHHTEIYALLDRNILTDIISIFKGHKVTNQNKSMKLVAGLMAFLQMSKITVEPNLALYEYAYFAGALNANKELKIFRNADNLHPRIYADIALNRKNKITKKDIEKNLSNFPSSPSKVEFSKELSYWNLYYVLVLKLALIQLQPLSQYEKMKKFTAWVFDKFYFITPIYSFASSYLNCDRSNKMIKNLKNRNRDKALLGIKNTTWDFILTNQWIKNVKKQEENNVLWLLCSRDKGLMNLAKSLFVSPDHCDTHEEKTYILELLQQSWGSQKGGQLHLHFLSCHKNINDKSRPANRGLPEGYINNLRDTLENEFLKWKP